MLARAGAELLDGLEALPGEHVVIKRRFSAFNHTHLDLMLRWGLACASDEASLLDTQALAPEYLKPPAHETFDNL